MVAGEMGFCFAHDPAKAQERAIARRKGGMAKLASSPGNKELIPRQVRSIEEMMTILDYALCETLALSNGIQRGQLLISIARGYIEAVKVGEQEQRLEAVEQALKIRKVKKAEAAEAPKG